jgi:protein-S-isoprenylcysteine O-methyltransferase Ste14
MLDTTERLVRRALACVALAALVMAVPGIVGSVRAGGPRTGRPELVFRPARLSAVTIGWFGAAALAWRPLPVRPGMARRLVLLAGGTLLFALGMALAVSARLALGGSYRPSSTLGVALAPDHRLVTTGPYDIVRHPMYLGLMAAAIGALAVFRTWTTVLFVIQLPVLVVRARSEDRLLAATFGPEWRRYAAAVPGWLPRLERSPGHSAVAEVKADVVPARRG